MSSAAEQAGLAGPAGYDPVHRVEQQAHQQHADARELQRRCTQIEGQHAREQQRKAG
jgi:hypothetical protein